MRCFIFVSSKLPFQVSDTVISEWHIFRLLPGAMFRGTKTSPFKEETCRGETGSFEWPITVPSWEVQGLMTERDTKTDVVATSPRHLITYSRITEMDFSTVLVFIFTELSKTPNRMFYLAAMVFSVKLLHSLLNAVLKSQNSTHKSCTRWYMG